MSNQPSKKAMNFWNKQQQQAAIKGLIENKDTAPRLAKQKALSNKVWIGAARTGPNLDAKEQDTLQARAPSQGQQLSEKAKSKTTRNVASTEHQAKRVPTKRAAPSGNEDEVSIPTKRSKQRSVVDSDENRIISKTKGAEALFDTDNEEEISLLASLSSRRKKPEDVQKMDDDLDYELAEPIWGTQPPRVNKDLSDDESENNEEIGTEIESYDELDDPSRLGRSLKENPTWSDEISSFSHDHEVKAGSQLSTKQAKTIQNYSDRKAPIKMPQSQVVGVGQARSMRRDVGNENAKPIKASSSTKRVTKKIAHEEFPQWRVDDDIKEEVQEGPIQSFKSRQKGRTQTQDNEEWPSNTHLCILDGNKVPLLKQEPRVRAILRLAIERLLGYLLFDNAFPDGEEKNRLSRDAVMGAAKTLRHENMVRRLKNDIGYFERVAKVVESRISQYRLAIKKVAATHVISEYGLKKGCADTVKALQKKRAIYSRSKMIQRNKPYGHPIFAAILSDTIFKDSKSIGFRMKDRLYSSIAGLDGELEAPPAMISFVATTVHVSIEEWEPGKFTPHNFTADYGQDIWHSHNSILAAFAQRKLCQYHKITNEILQNAMDCKKLLNNVEDLAKIDFDAMSDVEGEV